MDDTTIECPNCQEKIKISDVLSHKFKEQASRQLAVDQAEKIKTAVAEARQLADQDYRLKLQEQLKDIRQAEADRKQLAEANVEARDQNRQLKRQLDLQKKDIQAEFERSFKEQLARAREELVQETETKSLEKDKKLADTTAEVQKLKKQLSRVEGGLDQSSGQLRGEVLELDIEQKLAQACPNDIITEVKTGQRGADIHQQVRNNDFDCGLIVWEVKNARWSNSWQGKLKDDLRAAGADIGVLVSREIPDQYGPISQLSEGVWLVRPDLVVGLARVLRQTLIKFKSALQSRDLGDEQLQKLYDYIHSPQFRQRLQLFSDTFSHWQNEIDTEKRWFNRKWARQEKMIDSLISNTASISGDFEGLSRENLRLADDDLTVTDSDNLIEDKAV